MPDYFNKKKTVLFASVFLTATTALPVYAFGFGPMERAFSAFSGKVSRLTTGMALKLPAHLRMTEPFTTTHLLNTSLQYGAKCSKYLVGYSAYSAGTLFKGTGYLAHASSVATHYSGMALENVSRIDAVGQTLAIGGGAIADFGTTTLVTNALAKNANPTYLTNFIYTAKETVAITSLVSGRMTQSIGTFTRAIGFTSKVMGKISTLYTAPSLLLLSKKLAVVAEGCDDISTAMFASH